MPESSLAPRFGETDRPIETEAEYVSRVSTLVPNLPSDVLGQWLYEHWNQVSAEYGFLGWHRLSVTLESRATESLQRTNLGNDGFVDNLTPYFNGAYDPPPRLARIHAYFSEHGTWPRPVIFLSNEPPIEDCEGPTWGRPLHLVEGHHRMAAFLAFRASGRHLATEHQFWLLRQAA